MAVTEQITRPAPFVEKLGTNLAENVLAQQGVPIVTGGLGSISQLGGETADQFKARQDAAQRFDVRKQSLAGLAPQVADQDRLQTLAQQKAEQGVGSFQPFLTTAGQQAQVAAGLGTQALGQLGTAASTLGGVPLGAQAFQQDVSQFMSPYQSQVIDASLAEFDRNKAIQEQSIRDQQATLGALGSGRAGVQLAEFGTGAARERALLQAGLLQQGFQQAQGARQQDIANRFGLGQAQAGLASQLAGFAGQRAGLAGQRAGLGQAQAGIGSQQASIGGQQAGLAGATQNLGAFRSGLAGQQIGLGQAQEGILGSNIGRLGSLGAINQAQAQANLDAQREAARQATFLPQEQLDRFAGQVTGIMGGMAGSGSQQTQVPNPSPLQTALGVGTTLAGLYTGFKPPVQRFANVTGQ